MSHGNRNLVLARSRYTLTLCSQDGEYDPASNEGMTHSHGANTWFVPPDGSKHLFTYKSSTGKLRWYCNDVLKATVQMTSASK